MAKAKEKDMALIVSSQTCKKRPQLNLRNPKEKNR